jgi:GNAT superfamily N-acetyltransferase
MSLVQPDLPDLPRDVERLTPEAARDFRALTFPAFAGLLERDPAPDRPAERLGLRAADGTPVGLATAVAGPDDRWELASLFVSPLHRRRGYGRRLMTAAEAAMAAYGRTHGVHFCTVDADDQAVARFLLAVGWSVPQLRQVICTSTLDLAERTPWLIGARVPDGYAIGPWHGLGPESRAEIAALGLAEEVDPLAHEAECLQDTSLVLLRGAQPVGWLITHRLGDDLLRWTCSYVRPELQGAARIVPLWLECVRRQRRLTDMTRFVWTVPVSQPRMARFALKRMRPWLSRLAYACVSERRA